MYDRQKLIELISERALKRGEFKLASGKKSTYYLDGKQVTLHSTGLRLVSEGLLDLLDDVTFDAIGGMSIGADPIVAGVLAVAAERNRSLDGFLVRKEAKEWGTNRFIEGPVQPGAKVVIVDDVVTTGGSSLLAVDRIEEFGRQADAPTNRGSGPTNRGSGPTSRRSGGCEVVQVVSIVDRMEGGAANFAERGLPFRSLLTIEDFGIEPPVAT